MRVPQFENFTRLMAGFALFLAGAIIGSAMFMGIYQQNFSTLVLTNKNLQESNKQLTSEIESLRKNKNRQNVVGKVSVQVENASGSTDPLDVSIETEIKSRVYSDLKIVIGQPLSAIESNPKIYQNLIDRKIYSGIHEQSYIVRVNTLMISPAQLTVWISYSKNG